MKIVAISDTHGYLPELPECDVVCICGDILPLHIQKQYEPSLAWLAGPFQDWALNLKCEKVIFIAGNHDFVFEYLYNNGIHNADGSDNMPHDARRLSIIHSNIETTLFQQDNPLDRKIVYLQDCGYTHEGVKFYGTPWCPALKNWAFYGDSEDLETRFVSIQGNTDVLLTHCPPKYMGQGLVHETNWNYMQDFGCVELQNVLENKFGDQDLWVLSGHIHSGKHAVEKYNNIKYRNVSLKDEDYEVSFEPFVFEI